MIHISQEELFRKIQSEHTFDDIQEQHHEGEQATTNTTTTAQRQQSRPYQTSTRKTSFDCASLTSSRRSSLSGSNRLAQDMSSILPTTTTSYGTTTTTITTNITSSNLSTSARDKNNNSTSTNEDEVQAVLITGCGSKIGSNIAVAFAARGLKVALVDFDHDQTEAVARECQEKSPKNRVPLQIVADISQLAEAHKVIDRTIDAFGRLDVLVNTVNNASLMEAKFAASGDDDPHVFEQYHKIIANNMHAVTYLCISAAPYLRKTKGSIVNVSSITNNETGSYKFAYCMSKAGISTLTKCLATDWRPTSR